MIQYITWVIAFIMMYITIVWLLYFYLRKPKKVIIPKEFPSVSIVIPAKNEESCISKTLDSVISLNYPRDKIEVIVVDNNSTDRTPIIVKDYIERHKDSNIKLVYNKKDGKSRSLNMALKIAKGEYFAILDADSIIDKNSLRNLIHHFSEKKVAAVTTVVKVYKPKTFFQKLQKIEYIVAAWVRELMTKTNTLAYTPGVLSVYDTNVLRKVGGFDNNNLTEDFEIAMKLKYHKYNIQIEPTAITWTNVPKTFMELYRQRVRWYRGFIYNHIKYRSMFFNKDYGLMGFFQMPLNIIAVFSVLIFFALAFYNIGKWLYEFITRSIMIDNYLKEYFVYWPSVKQILLSQDVKILFPVVILLFLSSVIIFISYRRVKERFSGKGSIILYLFLFPYLVSAHFVSALWKEVTKANKKW